MYGHNIGDKTAADFASTHSAALVNLARAADLLKPPKTTRQSQQDVPMANDGMAQERYTNTMMSDVPDDQQDWYSWKTTEERKRTLYAVFIMSSLMVSTYNHAPTLTNSEIVANLPCEEEFWAAGNANAFYSKGGSRMADTNELSFHDALGELLRTSEKQQNISRGQQAGAYDPQVLPNSDLRPSTFGCLILINALHNYIVSTRS